MSKQLLYGKEAKEQIQEGINLLADAVKVTLGPSGRNVIIQQPFSSPLITKDGVTVAKSIMIDDPIKSLGLELIKDVASKTNDITGDGTTTATVLAQAIYNQGLASLSQGINPIDMKKGMDYAVNLLIEELDKLSLPIESTDLQMLLKVATTSSNYDEVIGNDVANLLAKIGKDGLVTIDRSNSNTTEIGNVDGFKFDRGFANPYFVTDFDKESVIFEDPIILVSMDKLMILKEVAPIIDAMWKTNRSIVIIAEDFDQDVLSFLTINKIKMNLKVVPVKAPGFGDSKTEYYEDIAMSIGAVPLSTQSGMTLKEFDLSMLGSCKKIVVDKDSTTIIGGNGDKESVALKVEYLRSRVENSDLPEYNKTKIKSRIARLTEGIATIKVSGNSDIEASEKMDRYDDAIHATQAAMEEGILAGGGLGLLEAGKRVKLAIGTTKGSSISFDAGVSLVLSITSVPVKQIVNNALLDEGGFVVKSLENMEYPIGYDARDKEFINLIDKGIIDPTKVTKTALMNAVSIVGTLLTTDCIIADKLEDKPKDN